MSIIFSLKPTTKQLVRKGQKEIRSEARRLELDLTNLKKEEKSILAEIEKLKHEKKSGYVELIRVKCQRLASCKERMRRNELEMNHLKGFKDKFDQHQGRESKLSLVKTMSAAQTRMVSSLGPPEAIPYLTETIEESSTALDQFDDLIAPTYSQGSQMKESINNQADELFAEFMFDASPSITSVEVEHKQHDEEYAMLLARLNALGASIASSDPV